MAEAKEPSQDSASSKDTMALIAEAEAEAAEAEALAAAARARARAARLRREAQAQAKAETAEAKTDIVEATDADQAETEEEVSDETAEDAESQSKPARSWRRVPLPTLSVTWKAAVIILICAFVGASGYMMWQRHETTERNQRVANFIAGARQGVVNMTSLDFNKAKEDVQRVIDSSTGQFRDDFQQRAKDFTTVVEQSKVVTQGTVNAAAVQSMDGNSALVLVAATSRITNAAGAKDEPRNWRLRVTVTDDGGQYKMSKLEFVP
jgi:Mce-associated membrane protein